jgi:small GTP-binding protein
MELDRRCVEIDGKFITLHIWDTAGQERFRALTTSFYRNARICVIVYDITSEQSFSSLNEWYNTFLSNSANHLPGDPVLLLGNKIDEAENRVVDTERGIDFANAHGMIFSGVSAKTSEGVMEAFEEAVRKLLEADSSQRAVEIPLEPASESTRTECQY